MKSGILYAIGFVLTISVPQAVAQGKTDESSDSTQVKPEGEKAEKEKKEDKKKGKSFDEVVKDFQAIDGLFRLYHNPEDNKVFLELTTDQLDKIFLCSISREVGDGTYFDSAAMIGRFPFIFKRVGEKILFIHKNVYFRADKDTAIHRAVVRGVANSIVGSAKIESRPHTERGSILVNPSGFFVQDIAMVVHNDPYLQRVYQKREVYDLRPPGLQHASTAQRACDRSAPPRLQAPRICAGHRRCHQNTCESSRSVPSEPHRPALVPTAAA